MRLILFTATLCPNCPAAERAVDEVRKVYPSLDVAVLNIEERENMQLALRYHVFSTPAIAIEDEVVFVGEAPTFEQLTHEVERRGGTRAK
ncbi:MAG: thioredoxin family protein [Candidatus Micrarchaeota archaeon]